jgi:hypothetical protein
MKVYLKPVAALLLALSLQSCFVYAAYGVYRTIRDINGALVMINSSLGNIRTVVSEGKELKRAAEDGRLIGSLAQKIPTLIQEQVEGKVKEEIHTLSGNLHASALDFARNAEVENLAEAKHAYNEMADTYNRFADLLSEMSDTARYRN